MNKKMNKCECHMFINQVCYSCQLRESFDYEKEIASLKEQLRNEMKAVDEIHSLLVRIDPSEKSPLFSMVAIIRATKAKRRIE